MDKEQKKQLQTLTVGSVVFYPAHGVASVTGREERQFGDAKQLFYVLELDRGGTLMVPLDKVVRAGVRELVSTQRARELLEKVKIDPEIEVKLDHASRKSRNALYADALRSGSADQYTELLQELLFRLKADKLSSSEQRTFDTARAYFVGEISAVLKMSPERLDEELLAIAV